ncbi:hypothetical protein IMZ48_14990 [Candidatus Bathyarchaeota archaeon]|nr:hypothetical protein [Candidatus Bathyarchaeota archaeon]
MTRFVSAFLDFFSAPPPNDTSHFKPPSPLFHGHLQQYASWGSVGAL